MSLAIVHSRASNGIYAPSVTIETHISNGIPAFSIVGLPETTVKESRSRVRSALITTQFDFPSGHITVNLAPADLPKDGGRFDLPIALSILAATNQIPPEALDLFEFAGELALSGEVRPITGAHPFAIATRKAKRKLILPLENVLEASLPGNLEVFPAHHLLEVCAHITQKKLISVHVKPPDVPNLKTKKSLADLSDVKGQYHAKRALEIAASGEHSLLLVGPPGAGKTMLASRLPSILTPMTEEESLESAAVLSIAGKLFDLACWKTRPFRSPHHTASSVALVGGGSPPKPGEISLTHHGVLFLDELPEFNRTVLDALREPLESGHITISRASYQSHFPAKFQLIAAMNPCPCGHAGNPNMLCNCTKEKIKRYQNKISGPFLDRIDMHVNVCVPPRGILSNQRNISEEKSEQVQARVIHARDIQFKRQSKTNTNLTTEEIAQFCAIGTKEQAVLDQAMEHFGLSARAYHRILKVARTIADLSESPVISIDHLTESLSYRYLDRRNI